MDLIISLLADIQNKKFKIIDKFARIKFSYKIKEDFRYKKTKNWFIKKYVKEGRGIKSLIKDYKLPMNYTPLRHFLIFMEINLHKENVANDFLRKRRSENAFEQLKNNRGIFSEETKLKLKNIKSIHRGIQGYYWNSSKNKFVWLRSSWEFIYAKWLNKNNINWDVEVKTYEICFNNKKYKYRPDFFIYKNNKLIKIIEIKGYWKDKLFKTIELNKQLNIDVICIDNITPYLENKINEEIKLWKKLRKLKLNV